jgi:hypothetical protein
LLTGPRPPRILRSIFLAVGFAAITYQIATLTCIAHFRLIRITNLQLVDQSKLRRFDSIRKVLPGCAV